MLNKGEKANQGEDVMGLVAFWRRDDEGVQFVVEESKIKQNGCTHNAGKTCLRAQAIGVTSIIRASFNCIEWSSVFPLLL